MRPGDNPGTGGKHNANRQRADRSNRRCTTRIDGGVSDGKRNVSLFREHEKTRPAHRYADRQRRHERVYHGRRGNHAEGDRMTESRMIMIVIGTALVIAAVLIWIREHVSG